MGKPKNTIPSGAKKICLPQNLIDRVDLILYSPLEGRVPFGAWKEFITQAIQEKLDRAIVGKVKERLEDDRNA